MDSCGTCQEDWETAVWDRVRAHRLIASLCERDALVVTAHMYGFIHADIGEALGVSGGCVRQIHVRALERMVKYASLCAWKDPTPAPLTCRALTSRKGHRHELRQRKQHPAHSAAVLRGAARTYWHHDPNDKPWGT